MNILKSKFLSLFLLIVSTSCGDNNLGKMSGIDAPKTMDSFRPWIPFGYEIQTQYGIDSRGGKIYNDSITFSYSLSRHGSLTPHGKLSIKYVLQSNWLNEISEKCFLGNYSKEELVKGLVVEEIDDNRTSLEHSSNQTRLFLSYKNEQCSFVQNFLSDRDLDEIAMFDQIEALDSAVYTKIYFSKVDDSHVAGAKLINYETLFYYSLRTEDFDEKNKREILSVLSESIDNLKKHH